MVEEEGLDRTEEVVEGIAEEGGHCCSSGLVGSPGEGIGVVDCCIEAAADCIAAAVDLDYPSQNSVELVDLDCSRNRPRRRVGVGCKPCLTQEIDDYFTASIKCFGGRLRIWLSMLMCEKSRERRNDSGCRALEVTSAKCVDL